MWVSGRSGVWRSENANSGMGGISFEPVVDGLANTVDFDVAGEPPNSPGAYAAVADHDWQLLLSSNHFETSKPPTNGGEPANEQPEAASNEAVYSIAFVPAKSPGDASLVAAGGSGTVEVNPDPFATSSDNPCTAGNNCWIHLTSIAGAPTIYGLAAGYDSSGNVLLVASYTYQSSSSQGIAVLDCSNARVSSCSGASWSYPRVSMTFGVGNTNRSFTFFWPNAAKGGKYIYVYDAKTGLWGSDNGGTTWILLDSSAALPATMRVAQAGVSGYMTGTGVAAGTKIWISEGKNGVYYYANPNGTCFPSGCTGSQIQSSSWLDPGPLTTDSSGNLYVAENSFDRRAGPNLYELSGSTSTSLSGSALNAYQASVLTPSSLATSISTSSSVYVYAASQGQGVSVAGPFTP